MSNSKPMKADELAGILKDHGLDNPTIAVGIAVAIAESNLVHDAVNVNDDNSIDRGIWQLNDKWHPDITDEAAFDPYLATRHAVRLKGDGDWTPWNAYKNGAWRPHHRAGWLALRLHDSIDARVRLSEENDTLAKRVMTLEEELARAKRNMPILQERVNKWENAAADAIAVLQAAQTNAAS